MSKSATQAADPRPFTYDAGKPQTFKLESSDEMGTNLLEHTFGPITDEALIAYDEARAVNYETHGKETDVSITAAAGALRLWSSLILNVEGYGAPGEELPENWKDLVPAEEKLQVIDDLLFTEVLEDAPGGLSVPRSWAGLSEATKTIRLRAYCDGREVFVEHTFRAKTAEDVMSFDRLRAGARLSKNAMTLRPSMKPKGALYDRMIKETDGYSGPVPLHHKALVITVLFETSAASIAKK